MEGRPKSSLLRRRSALRSGFLTGFATVVLGGSAAVAGAVLAHKFGRNTRTDGLLGAYGVYIVLAAAAQSFRNVVVPDLTRATGERRLGAETLSYAAAFTALALPTIAVVALLSRQFGDLITGQLPQEAASIAGRAHVWLVPAAFLQLFASLAASALAATDSYGAAALAYSLGGLANLALFVALADRGGVVALAWSVAFGSFVAVALQVLVLLRRRTLRDGRLARPDVGGRLWRLVEGSSLPLALQLFYVLAIRAAGGLGVGQVTSLSYAYLLAGTLVAATAVALGVISSR
jgi:O-antigen/teichoic acid export membrane protein